VIDSKLLLDDFEATAARLATKGVDRETLEEARGAVERHRAMLREAEELRAQSNKIAALVSSSVQEGGERPAALLEESRSLRNRSAAIEAEVREADRRARDLLLRLPNLPSPEAPIGAGEHDNVVLEVFDYDAERYEKGDFRPHWEIGEEFGIYDARRAANISGSMFALLRNNGARLLRALVDFGLDLNRGTYEEIAPPHMVRTETFTTTGHLPKFESDAYRLRDDDLWMIPTGEVPLMSLHRGETLQEAELPKRYMAYTVCFRREAGAAGKDTRGLQRLHEFHKVELVKFCTPDQAQAEFESLLEDARRAMVLLELPHRFVDLCTADLTFSSARIIDIEIWAPGTRRWLEASSVGYFTDFQTRRANIRYRPADGGRARLAHALNGSGLATPRVWAAIVEHGLQPDGETIRLPEALAPYFGADSFRRTRTTRP
jgi:seryl-tRNA synthetase